MLLGSLIGGVIGVIAFVAYSALRVSSEYDRKIEDQMQEVYLKAYKRKK